MKTKLTLLLVVAAFGASQPVLTQKGTLDSTFGVNGKVLAKIGEYFTGRSIALQRDEKIVVSGVSVIPTGFCLLIFSCFYNHISLSGFLFH
jgi:hypothetical protein